MSKHIKVLSISVIIVFVVVGFVAFRDKSEVAIKSVVKKKNIYPNLNTTIISNKLTDSSQFDLVNKSFEQFVTKWGLTGASIAIAKYVKLIYTRGFGYANKEDKQRMQPYNTMRVASVSKLITATAIMKLVEDGKLTLDDKVFGTNGILNDTIFLKYKDKRVEDITVYNLLNHSAGWRSRWGDHMFIKEVIAKELGKELPISLNDIVVLDRKSVV